MGLIKNLIQRRSGSTHFRADAALFEPDQKHRLVETALELSENGNQYDAINLLRAGAVRFHPFPEAEEHLFAIESSQAHGRIEQLEEQAAVETDVRLFATCARACDNLGDTAAAILHGRAAIQEDPISPLGYLVIGLSHLRGFRATLSPTDGLNALRYLSKSIQLRPGQGESLRALAELLILLRAPVAARRVLKPIAHALPNDPMLLAIEARAIELPPEGTSNFQELFLGLEENPQNHATRCTSEDISSETSQLVESFDGSIGAWVIGDDRQVVSSTTRGEADSGDADQLLGTLSVLLSTHCERMGIGTFKNLRVLGNGQLILARKLPTESTLFYSGSETDGIARVEQKMEAQFEAEIQAGENR